MLIKFKKSNDIYTSTTIYFFNNSPTQAFLCPVGTCPGRHSQPPRAQYAPGSAAQSASSAHRSPSSAPTAPTVAVVAVWEPDSRNVNLLNSRFGFISINYSIYIENLVEQLNNLTFVKCNKIIRNNIKHILYSIMQFLYIFFNKNK